MRARGGSSQASLGPPAAGLLVLCLAIGLWQGLSLAGAINAFIVPSPAAIAGGFAALVEQEGLVARFLQTFAETFAAALFGAGAGIPLGWLLHASPLAGRAFTSWVAGLAAAPLVLLYPLFLVVFGRNAGTIVAMGIVACVPAIALKTKDGLDGTRRVLVDVGRSFGLGPARLFRTILLPAALPTIFTGLRLGLIFALINVVGVEFLIGFGGLGELISDLANRFELAEMYGAILFVVLTSVCVFVLTERLERWLGAR